MILKSELRLRLHNSSSNNDSVLGVSDPNEPPIFNFLNVFDSSNSGQSRENTFLSYGKSSSWLPESEFTNRDDILFGQSDFENNLADEMSYRAENVEDENFELVAIKDELVAIENELVIDNMATSNPESLNNGQVRTYFSYSF